MRSRTVDQTGAEVVPGKVGEPRALDRAQVETAALALLDLVPDVPEDDGTGIFARLLDADDWEGLNLESKLPNGKDVVGRRLNVSVIGKRVSEVEVEEGSSKFRLPYYLVVDSTDIDNGEMVRWQTSAPALVLSLAKLHQWGKLPAVVQVSEGGKDRPGMSRPLNLTVLAVH
jgi:hypothetical protein